MTPVQIYISIGPNGVSGRSLQTRSCRPQSFRRSTWTCRTCTNMSSPASTTIPSQNSQPRWPRTRPALLISSPSTPTPGIRQPLPPSWLKHFLNHASKRTQTSTPVSFRFSHLFQFTIFSSNQPFPLNGSHQSNLGTLCKKTAPIS